MVRKSDIKHGIRDIANNLINIFLENHKEQVWVNGRLRDYLISNYILPLGPVLGSFIFIVYINDLLNIDCNRSIFCFSDDMKKIIFTKNMLMY